MQWSDYETKMYMKLNFGKALQGDLERQVNVVIAKIYYGIHTVKVKVLITKFVKCLEKQKKQMARFHFRVNDYANNGQQITKK